MVWSRDFAMTVRLKCVVREVAVQCHWKRQMKCSCACCGQRKGSTAGLSVSSRLEAHGNHLTPRLRVQQPRHHHRRQHRGHGQRQTQRDCRATGGGAGIGTRSEDCDGLNRKCICEGDGGGEVGRGEEGVGGGEVGRGEGCSSGGSAASGGGGGGGGVEPYLGDAILKRGDERAEEDDASGAVGRAISTYKREVKACSSVLHFAMARLFRTPSRRSRRGGERGDARGWRLGRGGAAAHGHVWTQ